ncbi:tripartite motif-containing 13 isoform X2 [Boleophthalmus pectinirostris]|nr:tripartite motif-containing 13 isoform X2 [Boleophthalmus pectinirostris]XP_055012843.1 tripartite motif-containing 13 isoform X2 [Boleophthalmus pectinirostris]
MEQLEEELTCPICCCLFEDPRVLLCSHSFCKKCLEGLLEGNRGLAFRTPLKCPTCRKETPHNGANSLQINYSLRGIVDKYSKIRLFPKMSVCKQHCGQPLNIFCATDLKLICGFCATTDEHRGHRFSSLEDAFKREKESFEELQRGVESWQSADILSCLETLQAGKKKALQSVSRDAEKVTDYFDKLISTIECKKNEILSDLETLKLVVMQAYDPDITRLSAALEEQERALSMAESFKSITDPLCFLQQMQEFRAKFRVLRETPLPSCNDMDIGPLVRNFDVKKWDSLRLKEVDKISVPHEKVSYRSGCTRVTAPRLMALFLRLSLAVVLLLSTHTLAASAQLRFEPLLSAVTSHFSQSAVFLCDLVSSSTSLLSVGQQYLINIMDSTVKFFSFYY